MATAVETRRATAVRMPEQEDLRAALDVIASLDMDDGYDERTIRRNAGLDGELRENKEKNRNLPAVVGTAVARHEGRQPTFHKAVHLPMYVQPGARAAGRALMQNYTDTPLEDMTVVSSLLDHPMNVQALAIFLDRHGEKLPDDVMEQLYGRSVTIPGVQNYSAETEMWTFDDYTFLHVTDNWSESIYAWATDRELSLENDEALRLR